MSLESRVEAVGRWVIASPLWTGLAVTLFFVLPTVVIPAIPWWGSVLVALIIGPPILIGLYLLYGLYGRLVDAIGQLFSIMDTSSTADDDDQPAVDLTVDQLKEQYARGEIGDETFERRLEQVIETDELDRQIETSAPEDELTARN